MNKKDFIIIFSIVLVSSFVGTLLAGYLLKIAQPSLQQPRNNVPSGVQSSPNNLPNNPPNNNQGLQNNQPNNQIQNLCGDGVCDSFEKQNNTCDRDCKK
jgi:predicted PurR-regulated permease PerM